MIIGFIGLLIIIILNYLQNGYISMAILKVFQMVIKMALK